MLRELNEIGFFFINFSLSHKIPQQPLKGVFERVFALLVFVWVTSCKLLGTRFLRVDIALLRKRAVNGTCCISARILNVHATRLGSVWRVVVGLVLAPIDFPLTICK